MSQLVERGCNFSRICSPIPSQIYAGHPQIEGAVQALRAATDTVVDLDTELAAAEDLARAEDERGRQLEETSAHIIDRRTHAHTAVAASTATPAATVTDLTETIRTRAHAYRNLPRRDRVRSGRVSERLGTVPTPQSGKCDTQSARGIAGHPT